MCLSCGCNLPDVDHDDPNHITYDRLRKAARAAGITSDQAAANIVATLKVSKDDVKAARRALRYGPGSDPKTR